MRPKHLRNVALDDEMEIVGFHAYTVALYQI